MGGGLSRKGGTFVLGLILIVERIHSRLVIAEGRKMRLVSYAAVAADCTEVEIREDGG